MISFRNLVLVLLLIAAFLWALTAPNWFASGAIGRAMTDLDIWAQIHIPYPVLTLLLTGFIITAATVRFRRRFSEEADSRNVWDHKR